MNLHLAWTGLPHNVYRFAGGVGSSFVQGVHGAALGGRTVFIPKSCAPYIVRSPEALRRLTLCNCECKVITIALCVGRRTPWSAFSSQRRLSQLVPEGDRTWIFRVLQKGGIASFLRDFLKHTYSEYLTSMEHADREGRSTRATS